MSPPLDDGSSSPDEWVREHADTYRIPGGGRRRADAAPLRADAKAGVPPPLPLVLFHEIEPVLDVQDFVQGVLLERSGGVVYGDSNAGKTFWVADLALHVAAGKEWNGRRVAQGGVVYCVLEGGNGFRNRVAGWRRANGYEEARIPFASVPSSLNLLDPDADTPRLIEAIKTAAARLGVHVKLVVINTLARALAGGNENGPEDMGALVLNMDAIRAATGACVLFIHHCSKDAARGARGHNSLRAAVDTEVEVQADGASGARVATVVKHREMRKGDVFGFTLETVELGKNRYGESVTTCVAKRAEGAVAPAGKKGPRLHEEAESLRREITNLFAAGHGKVLQPEPGMPMVPTMARDALKNALIRNGWLRLSGGHSVPERVSDAEYTRLWKRLHALKLAGIIGFNKEAVWLAKAARTP